MKKYTKFFLSFILIICFTLLGCTGEYTDVSDYSYESYEEFDFEEFLDDISENELQSDDIEKFDTEDNSDEIADTSTDIESDNVLHENNISSEDIEASSMNDEHDIGVSQEDNIDVQDDIYNESDILEQDGLYTSKEDVSLYIHTYNDLPDNYITKKEAQNMGWNSQSGNLAKVCPGMSIGGDRFNNYEGNLPNKKGRKYYECDIDYNGGRRNSKRIVYSSDGLIFYTEDHYETFTQLY